MDGCFIREAKEASRDTEASPVVPDSPPSGRGDIFPIPSVEVFGGEVTFHSGTDGEGVS